MRYAGFIYKWLTGQCFILYFGGGDRPKAAAPKAALPAPAAIAPPKESTDPVDTFNPETERKTNVRRNAFVLGSGPSNKKFGQKTILGAGL